MHYLKIILITLTYLILAGCATQTEYVTEVKEVKVTIPEYLLQPCMTPIPPAEEEFSKLSLIDQQSILTTYIIKLLGGLKDCRDKVDSIRDHQNRIIGGDKS
jgi:hypothetical protein